MKLMMKQSDVQKDKTPTSRLHGRSSSSLSLETLLLAESSTWSEDQKINWTKLAGRYGIEGANRGQTIKQYVAEKNVPIAMKKWEVIRQAKLRLPGGEITYPTHKTVAAQN